MYWTGFSSANYKWKERIRFNLKYERIKRMKYLELGRWRLNHTSIFQISTEFRVTRANKGTRIYKNKGEEGRVFEKIVFSIKLFSYIQRTTATCQYKNNVKYK